VAGFADALRGGERMPGWSWEQIIATARDARGDDPEGERAQFIQLVKAGQGLVETPARPAPKAD
jgi:Ca-activated chloride channel family protein